MFTSSGGLDVRVSERMEASRPADARDRRTCESADSARTRTIGVFVA